MLGRALGTFSVASMARGGFALASEVGGLSGRGGGGSGRGGVGFLLAARSAPPSLSSSSPTTVPAPIAMTSSAVPPPPPSPASGRRREIVWASLESGQHDCANNHERPDRVRAAVSKLEICRRIDLGLETTSTTTTTATTKAPTPRAIAAAEAVHSRAYLSRLQALCDASREAKEPLKVADEDDETEFTYVTPTSLADALAAVETSLALWDLVDPSSSPSSSSPSSSSSIALPRAGLALVRPPGHHAGRGVEGAEADSPDGAPSGFCLVNTAAAVARSIAAGAPSSSSLSSSSSSEEGRQSRRSRRRVLVIDWDVHVGDGTQDIFWGHRRREKKERGEKKRKGERGDDDDEGEEEEEEEEEIDVCVIDLHEAGAWPGGGGIELRGLPRSSGSGGGGDGGEGRAPLSRVVNVPLPPGSGDAAARAAFERVVVPFAARFKPEAIVVSAGFDAHELEPLAGLNWDDGTYQFLGAATAALAESFDNDCGLLFVLEGGYSRRALGSAVAALAKGAATLEVPPAGETEGGERDPALEREVEAAIRAVVEEHGL